MAIENCILGLFVLFCTFETILSQITTACAGAPSGVFVRNSQSCQAYYYCLDGEAHPNECPENYLFEPIRQVCHSPSYVQCTGCSPYGIQNIAHPTDCSSYYLCVSGIRTLQKCRDNLIFDKSIGDCNAASTVQCIRDNTQICAEYGGYVKIGDPDDCSKYYTCYYGDAYHQECAPGLFFKPSIASCTFPEEYDFCQGYGLSSDNNSDEAIVLIGDKNSVDPVDIPNVDDSKDEPTDSVNDELIDEHSDNFPDGSSENNDEELADNNNTDDFADLSSSENPGDNSNKRPSETSNEGPSENSNEGYNDNSNDSANENSNEGPSDNSIEALNDNSDDDNSYSYIGTFSNETQ